MKIALAASLVTIAACTPKYDWREVHGTDAPFSVMLPSKPSVHARPVNLDGTEVTMVMTAAEVDGTVFAVGAAQLPDAAAAQTALRAMKTAMVNNINGQIKHEKSSAGTAAGIASSALTSIEIEAVGPAPAKGNGQSRLLIARFSAHDKWVYQAIVMGSEASVSRDQAETFLTSFKLNPSSRSAP